MRERVILLLIIVIIAMKSFTKEDKLTNYSAFNSMRYNPIVEASNHDDKSMLSVLTNTPGYEASETLRYLQGIGASPKPTESPKPESKDKKESPNPFNSMLNANNNYSWHKPEAPARLEPGHESESTPPANTRQLIDGVHLNLTGNKLYDLTRRAIAQVETGSKYSFMRWDTGKNGSIGSGAWGAYQFIGRDHEAAIKRVTGLSLNGFIKDKNAQDKYFAYHYQKNLMPLFKKARQSPLVKHLSDVEIMGGLHFRMNDFLKMYANGTAGNKVTNNPALTKHVEKIRLAAYGS